MIVVVSLQLGLVLLSVACSVSLFLALTVLEGAAALQPCFWLTAAFGQLGKGWGLLAPTFYGLVIVHRAPSCFWVLCLAPCRQFLLKAGSQSHEALSHKDA